MQQPPPTTTTTKINAHSFQFASICKIKSRYIFGAFIFQYIGQIQFHSSSSLFFRSDLCAGHVARCTRPTVHRALGNSTLPEGNSREGSQKLVNSPRPCHVMYYIWAGTLHTRTTVPSYTKIIWRPFALQAHSISSRSRYYMHDVCICPIAHTYTYAHVFVHRTAAMAKNDKLCMLCLQSRQRRYRHTPKIDMDMLCPMTIWAVKLHKIFHHFIFS